MIPKPEDFEIAKAMFNDGKSTFEVQSFFCKKYDLPKMSMSANFIKKVRKQMGIYKPVAKKGKNHAE